MRRVIFFFFFFFFFFSERAARGKGGGGAARLFLIFIFPCSADHERDWPPCKVVFFGLATNALNVRNNYTVDPRLPPVGNPVKYHVVALYLQPL